VRRWSGLLSDAQAGEVCQELLSIRRRDAVKLDLIRSYWLGTQELPVVPTSVPAEVKRMAEMSRINVCGLVVNVPAQSMFVTGIRDETNPDTADQIWGAWQANKMDAHQSPIHRACLAYGTAYLRVLPGEPVPVMLGRSPRQVTTAYASDPDWPDYALEMVDTRDGRFWELYDGSHRYRLSEAAKDVGQEQATLSYVGSEEHGAPVCPFVRYSNLEDLEYTPHSEITPVMPLQDQLDLTTFNMLVAQHYGAFRQRYIMGWLADSESEKIKASASRLITFDDPDVKVGEFGQTDLTGYLKSRQATMEQFGVVSQVPPHNLLGQMVNLSAEALVAAEVGHTRKMLEREQSFGESVEQAHWLAGQYIGVEVSDSAQVRWRDTEARSFAATVDGLAKIAQSLKVPVQALWERIPDVSQQDVEDWKTLATSTDALAALDAELERQATPPT